LWDPSLILYAHSRRARSGLLLLESSRAVDAGALNSFRSDDRNTKRRLAFSRGSNVDRFQVAVDPRHGQSGVLRRQN
jgi:hypothetical protein